MHRDEFQLQYPVLLDEAGLLRQKLQPTHTPQAIVDSQFAWDGTLPY